MFSLFDTGNFRHAFIDFADSYSYSTDIILTYIKQANVRIVDITNGTSKLFENSFAVYGRPTTCKISFLLVM